MRQNVGTILVHGEHFKTRPFLLSHAHLLIGHKEAHKVSKTHNKCGAAGHVGIVNLPHCFQQQHSIKELLFIQILVFPPNYSDPLMSGYIG